MKKLFLFLLLPISLSAQQKRDNQIIVHQISFKEALIQTLNNGFTFSMKDDSLQIFSTSPKPAKQGGAITIHGRIIADSLTLTGELNMNMTLNFGSISSAMGPIVIECRGEKNSPLRQAWNDMNDLAKSFNKPITYLRR
jgi:hypothetical protein